MDIRIVADTADHLYCTLTDSPAGNWVLSGVLFAFGLIAVVLATVRARRYRALSLILSYLLLSIGAWFLYATYSSGALVREFEIERSKNSLLIQAYYTRSDAYQDAPKRVALDTVVRADMESSTRNRPERIMLTLSDGSVLYPLGSDEPETTNRYLVLGEIRAHLNPPQQR